MIMKRISILFLLLFVLVKSYGQDTVFAHAWSPSSNRFLDLNDRDTTSKYIYIDTSQTNNIWQLGAPSKSIFDSAYSSPLVLATDTLNTYSNNNISSFSFIIWTDCNVSGIDFWHRINADSTDGGIVEYSIDGGTTWNNIINSSYSVWNFYLSSDTIASNSNKAGFTGTSGWVRSSFWGPTLNNIIEYRFTFTSDSINNNKDGWMIDDISIQNGMVGINELRPRSDIHVFPNPTSNFITIQTENNIKFKSAEIKDVLGKTILTSNNTTIDLSKFEAGIYFVEIATDKGKYVKRVIRN